MTAEQTASLKYNGKLDIHTKLYAWFNSVIFTVTLVEAPKFQVFEETLLKASLYFKYAFIFFNLWSSQKELILRFSNGLSGKWPLLGCSSKPTLLSDCLPNHKLNGDIKDTFKNWKGSTKELRLETHFHKFWANQRYLKNYSGYQKKKKRNRS